jgi:nucleoid DNA-binding protein
MAVEFITTTRVRPEKTRHKELATKISQNTRLSIDDVILVLKALPFALIDSLEIESDKVFIENFGTFTARIRKGKEDTLNPDKKRVRRRDKLVIHFSPSKNFITYTEQDIRNARKTK